MSEWRPIKGYEGLYEISDTGNVKSIPRKGTRSTEPKIMIVSIYNHGYPQVTLTKHGKGKTARIHRLVADAFLPNPNGLPEINHIDEDKTNNNVNNLEWCTRIYNINYGNRTAKTRKRTVQMNMDGVKVSEYESLRAAGAQFGKNAFSRISEACLKKRPSAYGYKWKYKEVNI